ncbi:HAD-like domain-containing protein [Cynara cardunculus var. scolymus]|uniref:HAD-like domain-containing protein n=1 Tax=Cynara cardunculus var. scolymus TaxID=59895 RepID=A0A118K2K4_CYNCS|nr:HAD-like domain-containing protein [Cynara cardunculus var. scolymus]
MHLKSNHSAPVLIDPMNKSRLGLYDALLPYSSGAVFSPGLFLTVTWKKPGVHCDVRSTSSLDAMQSSSPTHRKLKIDSGIDISSNDVAVAYGNWMLKYPSALTSFDHIINNAKGKRIALFLDYDGTLSPIVDNPDLAFMSDAMRTAVKNVAKDIPTTIISGRSRVKVHEFVGLRELYYAGSHGMDIMGPVRPPNDHMDDIIWCSGNEGEEGNLFQPASEFLPMINEVLEVRPVLKWDKGKAVEFLLESLAPKESSAFYSLRDPSEVMEFLKLLSDDHK